MYGLKGWVIPIVVFIVLFSNILLGIYQNNFHKNPWAFYENYTSGFQFLEEK